MRDAAYRIEKSILTASLPEQASMFRQHSGYLDGPPTASAANPGVDDARDRPLRAAQRGQKTGARKKVVKDEVRLIRRREKVHGRSSKRLYVAWF